MNTQEIKEKIEELHDLILDVLRDSQPPNIEQETLDKLQQTAWFLQDSYDLPEC